MFTKNQVFFVVLLLAVVVSVDSVKIRAAAAEGKCTHISYNLKYNFISCLHTLSSDEQCGKEEIYRCSKESCAPFKSTLVECDTGLTCCNMLQFKWLHY